MLSKTVLLILPAFAAVTAADQVPHPLAARTLPALQARQTGATACVADVIESIEAIVSPFPAVPRGLIGITDINPIDDPCNYTPPASMASAFTSYSRDIVSWVSESWPKVTSALAKCGPEASSDIDGFARAWNLIVCTNDVIDGGSKPTSTGNGVAQTTATEIGSESRTRVTGTALTGSQTTNTAGTGSAGSERSSTAGAARETGFVVGVVAAIGLVGAVAAL